VLTAADIARLVGGTLVGDGGTAVGGVAPLDRAGAADVSFLASAKYTPAFARSRAGVTLVAPDLATAPGPAVRVIVRNPHDALLTLLPHFYTAPVRTPGVDPTARIAPGARLADDVTIDPFAVIGAGASLASGVWIGSHCVIGEGVEIGRDTRLFPRVTVYSGSRLGQRVAVHSGTVIGSDGFGYVFRDGVHAKIPHVGRCLIGDDVEIGANTAIDRGSIDDTIIGAGTKIDNLVHISHNVHVGRCCLLLGQSGIGGSSRLDDFCVMAGQSALQGHLTMGAGARLGGQAGGMGSIPAGQTYSGYPARPHVESLRAYAAMHQLPKYMKLLERLLQDDAARGDPPSAGDLPAGD
jgi:UDP-3-O-[3-hydroxymyristoyl] glucosamine N-acyltransferase